MTSFKELYQKALKLALNNDFDSIEIQGGYEPTQLDCLLHPEKHPLVFRTGECSCSAEEREECIRRCPFGAIGRNPEGGVSIDPDLCMGCSACITGCSKEKLEAATDMLPVLKAVRFSGGLAFALIAPAFPIQFGEKTTPGMLRTALKAIGFDGMIETALFADILTLKEALEFNENIKTEEDFQLTSCCCPMWIAMIRKIYHELMPHVPGSVSPMVACARTIKILYPDAITVFIGPCIAKKAEAREKDLAGAVDYVLTFREVQTLFELLKIDPSQMEDSEKDHSSGAGRIYARAGGVSEAVRNTLHSLEPDRAIALRSRHADGVPACKAMINDILLGKGGANFYEGMGCKNGCVGGPKSIVSAEEAREAVGAYAAASPYRTPSENPYVMELLHRLKFDTVESLLEDSEIFTRHFNA